jgi:type I restriction enzyme R subunit
MTNFNESNTIEAYINFLLCGKAITNVPPNAGYSRQKRQLNGIGWYYLPPAKVPRNSREVFVESFIRNALIRLNPEIASNPDRAEEVLYKLRAIVLAIRSDGLVKANEEMTAWLRGDRTMPFGQNHEHTPIHIIDFDNLENNQWVLTNQYTYLDKRADLVLLVNGFPLVVIEAKTPVRKAISWVDGAIQLHDDYEKNIPELFVCNVFNVATEGKELRYGSIRMPLKLWGPWRLDEDKHPTKLVELKDQIQSLLHPAVILDILAHYTLFATDAKKRRLKIICRYQQYEAGNRIVNRAIDGYPKKGLIWHFQGSGKSLLMVFAARKLRMEPRLKNPTVLIVVDRLDLDAQIGATFHASDIPNLVKAETREELEKLLRQDTRKIIITTIFRFAEAEPNLNPRENIIVLVDEAHRTQEGDLGIKMRAALPNAFLFGFTGTPINRSDRNTFLAFGAAEDERGYLSQYDFSKSLRDGATLPIHFEPRLVELHIDREAIDEAYRDLTGGLSDLDRDNLAKTASRTAVLVKAPDRIAKICADIARHYRENVEPNGFKGMVVTYDQESCLLYKNELEKYFSPEAIDIVISATGNDDRLKPYDRSRDREEKLLDRYRDRDDPLKLLIVTAKLLTGFDAPILQAMYLDKPLKAHTLLQAICRTNRTYGERKTHGLIVDYLGSFDDAAAALDFDEEGFQKVAPGFAELKEEFPRAMEKCLAYFAGCDRSLTGFEGLIVAQDCLPDNDRRDDFAADFSVLTRLWEAVSPDPLLLAYETDYRWLSRIYISLKPTTGAGKLLWHTLGAKTIELIHRNVSIEAIRDDLEAIVLDAELLEVVQNTPDPRKKSREIEIKIAGRLRKRVGDPRYKELSERLESLKERHERGQLLSVAFLKELLDLARDLIAVERETPPEPEEDRGKAALTALFLEVRTDATPKTIERIVNDIDEIVRLVRFPGWQNTTAGEREVRRSLRKTLFKYQLHQDAELFEKAYRYIAEYY